MLAYYPGLNVDRLVAFSALVAFAKVQQANRGYSKREERDDENNLQKSKNLYKLKYSPFTNIGRGKGLTQKKFKKPPFRNFK
jgi:hypothetical protein